MSQPPVLTAADLQIMLECTSRFVENMHLDGIEENGEIAPEMGDNELIALHVLVRKQFDDRFSIDDLRDYRDAQRAMLRASAVIDQVMQTPIPVRPAPAAVARPDLRVVDEEEAHQERGEE